MTTMSKRAIGPFGAIALLKEFALTTEKADVIRLHWHSSTLDAAVLSKTQHEKMDKEFKIIPSQNNDNDYDDTDDTNKIKL